MIYAPFYWNYWSGVFTIHEEFKQSRAVSLYYGFFLSIPEINLIHFLLLLFQMLPKIAINVPLNYNGWVRILFIIYFSVLPPNGGVPDTRI